MGHFKFLDRPKMSYLVPGIAILCFDTDREDRPLQTV